MGDLTELVITKHAIDRFRFHWPDSGMESDERVRKHLQDQLTNAIKQNDFTRSPSGTYYPISYLGSDGYAIVQSNKVTTVVPEAWATEINEQRRKHG